jgi:hypothetical protein
MPTRSDRSEPAGRKKPEFSDKADNAPIALGEAGIDKNLAHRARNGAKLSETEFEQKVVESKKTAAERGNLKIKESLRSGPRPKLRVPSEKRELVGALVLDEGKTYG